jgi:hypothetical protein
MFLTKAIQKNFGNLRSSQQFINFSKFSFARKSFLNNKETELIKEIENETKSEKTGKSLKSSKQQSNEPTLKVVKQEIPIRISPYFSKAVSEKEKSVTNISVTQAFEEEKEEVVDKKLAENDLRKHKQKLASARRQKDRSRKIDVLVETIKRELPKEM